ncbi:MAG: hypothetical protein M9921_14765 [Fimbriimonadaceae bacterium]|nr:hypothetical protein [Fimbriimonadaceae bacterium]
MVWVAAFLPLLGHCLGPDAVDFDAKAAPLGQVLERLAAGTGSKLAASPKIAREIVFVHVQGVRLDELKAKLAEAVVGEWTREGETEVLGRGPAQERAIRSEHLAYRRKLVDAALKDAQAELEHPYNARALAAGFAALPTEASVRNDLTAGRARYLRERSLIAQGPLSRLLKRLVLACDPRDLAAVGPFSRALFTTSPTQMQRGFDRKKFDAAVALFAKEQQAWIDEAAKVTLAPDPGATVSDPRTQLRFSPSQSRFVLEVRRGEMTALFNVNLQIGKAPWGQIVNQASFADPARSFMDAHMLPGPPLADDREVELSPDSREFEDAFRIAAEAATPATITPKLRQLMLGVETNDPLSWVVSDALAAYAEVKGVNLVAAVPDRALTWAHFMARGQPLRVKTFMQALLGSETVRLDETEGWAVLVPADRFEAALDFTPRSAVAALVKSVFEHGRLDMKEYARYAFASKRLNRGGIGDWFLAMIDRSVLGASDRTDWNGLRLYGSLSELQQRDLEAGARLPYAGMNLEQRAIIERIVFGGEIRSEVQTGSGITKLSATSVEPTDAFPTGVPATCVVTGRSLVHPTLVAYGKDAEGTVRPLRGLDPSNLAGIELNVRGDPEQMAIYGVANLVGYAPGADKKVMLRVEVVPGVWTESVITIADYDPKANPVSWEQLPEPYREQIAKAIESIRARKANPPTRSVPPPRRRYP